MGCASRPGVRPMGEVVARMLWYDRTRWPSFIDGFAAVAKTEGDWPQAPSTLVWDSRPGGRGRVVERVTDYEVRSGQTARVEDEKLTGIQSVAFVPLDDGTEMTLSLDYRLKSRNPVGAVVDVLFIRRALGDSLRRTLLRFSRELSSDLELLR